MRCKRRYLVVANRPLFVVIFQRLNKRLTDAGSCRNLIHGLLAVLVVNNSSVLKSLTSSTM